MPPDIFVYLDFLRKVLLPLPGVTEKTYVGYPAFYVNNKIFTRLKEDNENLVLGTVERDRWLKANPNVYHVTGHYLNYDYVLVRLAQANPEELKGLLITAWLNRATKKLIKQHENAI